jgi:hypothetical protein
MAQVVALSTAKVPAGHPDLAKAVLMVHETLPAKARSPSSSTRRR